MLKFGCEVFSRNGVHMLCQTFRGSLMDEVSAVLASTRSQIEDEVRAFQDVEVVFNDHNRVSLFEQGVK